jgi:hypothetical protein
MRDYIMLSSAPVEEDCAQVGNANYSEQAQRECRELIRMMEEIHPEQPKMFFGYYKIKGFPHDFGTYYEVVAMYDDENEESIDWAFDAESLIPEHWDELAKKNLRG